MSFWQVNYAAEMMFCNINDVVMIIKQAFSIKSVNNDLSAAWGSENEVWKSDISSSERLNKYNYIYI